METKVEGKIQRSKSDVLKRLLRDDRTSPILLLVLAVLFLYIVTPDKFLQFINLRNVVRFASFYIIVGVGTLIVFMAGEMDMSTGSVMGMGGIVAAFMARAGVNVWLIFLVVVIIGVVCGMVNGLFVGYWGLPAFVATLGVQKALRGLITVVTQGYAVNNMSDGFLWLGGGDIFSIPVPIYICIIVCVISWYLINKTVLGPPYDCHWQQPPGGHRGGNQYQKNQMLSVHLQRNLGRYYWHGAHGPASVRTDHLRRGF